MLSLLNPPAELPTTVRSVCLLIFLVGASLDLGIADTPQRFINVGTGLCHGPAEFGNKPLTYAMMDFGFGTGNSSTECESLCQNFSGQLLGGIECVGYSYDGTPKWGGRCYLAGRTPDSSLRMAQHLNRTSAPWEFFHPRGACGGECQVGSADGDPSLTCHRKAEPAESNWTLLANHVFCAPDGHHHHDIRLGETDHHEPGACAERVHRNILEQPPPIPGLRCGREFLYYNETGACYCMEQNASCDTKYDPLGALFLLQIPLGK